VPYAASINWGSLGTSDISSFSLGTQYGQAGGPAPQAQIHDCTCTKNLDSLSSTLWAYCSNGTTLPTVVVTLLQQGADGSTTAALIYTMNNVVISSARVSGDGQSEILGLNFDSMTYSTP
jgi:type VI protein secretion system component Hcp